MPPRYATPLRAGLFLGVFALTAPLASAQPDPVPAVNGRLVASVSGTVLTVTAQLQTSTGDDDLGTTTLRFGFNDASLNPASGAALGGLLADGTDYTYANFDNGADADYGNATVSYPLAGRIHVNIELNNDNAGTLVTQAPSGWTDVVTVRFAIVEPLQTSMNVFFAGSQEVYDGDNATLWTAATFTGADVQLPVELVSFEASVDGAGALLRWATASETNNAGFHVETRPAGEAAWREVAFVPGAGTTAEGRLYSTRVGSLAPGRHAFRLRQVDFDGAAAHSAEVEAVLALATPYAFALAGPNPFRDRTRAALAVREPQRVRVELTDALGRRIAVLHDALVGTDAPLRFDVDASGFAAGTYMLVARGERFAARLVVTLVR